MIGKTMGHYRVGEQLGRGGMGEVYVADDLNLNRKVALKFLPDAFTGDPERMARFEREAKVLASLNHPNIAAIYGLEQAEGKRFIVMELVEGETLAQRLNKGALPIEDALGICRQIAEGLEAAHERGVIHRDLKPANVMITEGDKVKILDFGLAKALSEETQSVDSSHSPTLTEAMTRPGVILGTAAYMSPEQAKGKAVDKRADIWAFGCILYECLTGRRAFWGETVTETLAAVLTKEPEWEKTPATMRPLLRGCLEKNPARRLRDIGDARRLLDGAPEFAPVKRLRIAWSIAALFVLTTAVTAPITYMHLREKPPVAAEPIRFQISPPGKLDWSCPFAVSPNGRYLAFSIDQKSASGVKDEELLLKSSDNKMPTSSSNDGRFLLYTAIDPKTKDDLWVLPLERADKPIAFLRTEFNELDGRFSPDTRWVAYVSDESGSNEIAVRGFSKESGTSSETGGKWQVSQGGGTAPRWRGDGNELYYRSPDGKIMVAVVTAGTLFQSGTPRPLFQAPPDLSAASIQVIPLSTWDVTSDGSRFLLTAPAAERTPTPFTVVLNWPSLLKKF